MWRYPKAVGTFFLRPSKHVSFEHLLAVDLLQAYCSSTLSSRSLYAAHKELCRLCCGTGVGTELEGRVSLEIREGQKFEKCWILQRADFVVSSTKVAQNDVAVICIPFQQ